MISGVWVCLFPSIVYLLFLLPHIGHNRLYVIGDNLIYHYPMFSYFVNALKFGHGIPDWLPPKLSASTVWFPSEGGIPIDLVTLNFFPFLPHRIFGYALAMVPGIDLMVTYKLSIFAGVLLTALGWWCFLRRQFEAPLASLGAAFLLFSGVGVTPFQGEPVLAVMELVPWILYAAVRVAEHPIWLLPASYLLSSLLTQHYPHIPAIVLAALLGCLWSAGKLRPLPALVRKIPIAYILAAGLVLVAGLFPLYRIWALQGDFTSPLRGGDLSASTLAEYVRLNQAQVSSAPFAYLLHLVIPFYRVGWVGGQLGQWGDQFGFSVFPVVTVLAVYGAVVRRVPRHLFLFWVILILCSLGINGFLPQLLYLLHVPFLAYFRQWYLFHPYVVLTVCYLAVYYLSTLEGASLVGIRSTDGRPLLTTDIKTGAVMGLLVITPLYGVLSLQSYVQHAFLKSEVRLSQTAVKLDLSGRYESIYTTLPMPDLERNNWPPVFISKQFADIETLCEGSAVSKIGNSRWGAMLTPRLLTAPEPPPPDIVCSVDAGVETMTTPKGLRVTVAGGGLPSPNRYLLLPYPPVLGLKPVDRSGQVSVRVVDRYVFLEKTTGPESPWPSPVQLELGNAFYSTFLLVWCLIGMGIAAGCAWPGRKERP